VQSADSSITYFKYLLCRNIGHNDGQELARPLRGGRVVIGDPHRPIRDELAAPKLDRRHLDLQVDVAADVSEAQPGENMAVGSGQAVQVEGPLLVGHGEDLVAGRQVRVGDRLGFQPHRVRLYSS